MTLTFLSSFFPGLLAVTFFPSSVSSFIHFDSNSLRFFAASDRNPFPDTPYSPLTSTFTTLDRISR